MRPAERHRRDPTPNGALRALLEESGWTQEAFARAIGRLGAEAGVRLGYDRTSVAHWLRGSRPAPRVQGFIAEALSRRLGRPIPVTQLGMGDGRFGGPGPRPQLAEGVAKAVAEDEVMGELARRGAQFGDESGTRSSALHEQAGPADQLAALTAAVVGPPRADPPPPAPYRLTLLPPASTAPGAPGTPGTLRGRGVGDEPTETPEPLRPRPPRAHFPSLPRGGRPPRRTTPDEVASVREHARFFAQQADRHGGGHIRTPLAASLAGLVRRLRTGGEGPYHPQLVAGAARLSYLLARVYADEQRHGLAQRAFGTAAQLAAEGDDPEGVALVQRALSSQAYQLGHRRQSLALAESACQAAPADVAPSARSFLYAGLAVAQAAEGERREALAALRRAEHELARAPADLTTGPESPDGGEPVGAYQDAALHYQAGQVRAALGDRDGAIRELRASLSSRPSGERRSRALSEAELAELLLAGGRLEEACSAWEGFLDDSALVRSGRARRARDRMPRLLRPYVQERCVQGLLTRTGLPLKATGAE
ncbi:helix-turn-helix transcriptional regulator [Streptomyces winkii]|uniref:helix-turn-helix transcriptional regulator n=1 Tax=Streptomyces winkii TaxID=3051178 RepID=UPI0028D5B8E6|nr:helix-turn-helix transcriptional regulator [Streptomyces sp. DSM 40971]